MKKSEHESNKFYKHFGPKGLAALATSHRIKDDLKLIKNLSKKSDKILDLACGYGRITLPMAKAAYNIVGIDLAPNMIREAKLRAKKQGLKVHLKIGSMVKLPYEPNTFDRVFCLWSSFNHLLTKAEQIKAINEMHRVLKPGSLAFLEMMNAEKKRIADAIKKEGVGPDKKIWGEVFNGIKNFDYMHSRKTLKAVCEKSDLRRFRVCFMNIHGRRRIVAELYK